MVDIRPKDLPGADLPVKADDILIVDQGVSGVRKVKVSDVSKTTSPLASKSEAEVGSNNTKTMTPLRVKESIQSEIGVSLASFGQGDKADSAVQPLDPSLVPTGGLTGQVLVKATNTAFDTEWKSIAAATAVSYGPQTLTPAQQTQARNNIGSASIAQGDKADTAVSYAPQTLTPAQQTQARQNIQADKSYDSIASVAASIVPAFANAIRTNGYYAAGDGGGALYKRVPSEPSHTGKVKSADGAWWELSELNVCPEMFGAKGDETGDGTGTDDRAAFQNAMNYSRLVLIKTNKCYRIHGTLQVPRFQQLIGVGGSSASDSFTGVGVTGSARLLFTGTGGAWFVNQDPDTMLSHGEISGFTARDTGGYTAMMYFKGLLSFRLAHLSFETDNNSMIGLKSEKINSVDFSWLNLVVDVSIRLPDTNSSYVMDVDWSDSVVERSALTGGLGSIDRGYGVRWVNNIIQRSAYVGLTIMKSGNIDTKNTICIGNSFDVNKTHGILFQVSGDLTSTRVFKTVISSNNFRTSDPNTGVAGGYSISTTKDAVGNDYEIGPIVGNVELRAGVPMLNLSSGWTAPQNVGNMDG